MKPMTPEELEQFIHRNLRSLPERRAPRTLESRVMAALESRALIPWYHRSWSYWPAAVRAAFLVVATGVMGAVMAGFYLGINGASVNAVVTKTGEQLGFVTKFYHLATWVVEFGGRVVSSIPPLWLYGGVALVAALYATFFGLGAAAYRTLYRNN